MAKSSSKRVWPSWLTERRLGRGLELVLLVLPLVATILSAFSLSIERRSDSHKLTEKELKQIRTFQLTQTILLAVITFLSGVALFID